MKKLWLLIIPVFLTLASITFASEIDTSNWQQYKHAGEHSYIVKFPSDWKVITTDSGQTFQSKSDANQNVAISIFQDQNYDKVITSFVSSDQTFITSEDLTLSLGEETPAKVAFYSGGKDVTFIKRGRLILAIEKSDDATSEAILKNLRFKDDWHQYVDFKNKYTFIFPDILDLQNLNESIYLKDITNLNYDIFRLSHHEETDLKKAAKSATLDNHKLKSTEDIFFHNIQALEAIYLDKDQDKRLSRIFLTNGTTTISMTNLNIEENFPHLNYYDDYILEILESFEFFDIDTTVHQFKNFSDVRDNHPNEKSINQLVTQKVISGYADGTFKPDGEINRAELTKMIVASITEPDPDKYQGCFSDVDDQWYAPYICYAKDQEWVQGYDSGKFKPEQKVNRAEALKIILNAILEKIPQQDLEDQSVTDIDQEAWYSLYFNFAANSDLLDLQHTTKTNGKYSYLPQGNISRKEVAETLYRSLNLD